MLAARRAGLLTLGLTSPGAGALDADLAIDSLWPLDIDALAAHAALEARLLRTPQSSRGRRYDGPRVAASVGAVSTFTVRERELRVDTDPCSPIAGDVER